MAPFEIRILDSRVVPPEKATELSGAVDLRAVLDAPLHLHPSPTATLIGTGLAINLGRGYAAMLLPRSGMGHKRGLVLGNLVGLIDGDYQGEIFISAWNRGSETIIIPPFERIAQMVILPVVDAYFVVVKDFSERSVRGSGGFGSTG